MSENVETSGAPQRPAFLTVLCILSFIAAGFGIIGMLLVGAGKGIVENAGVDLAEEIQNAQPDALSDMQAEALNNAEAVLSWPYIICATILILASLYGVIKMWNLKKQGFFIYAGAGIAGIILPLLFGIPFETMGAVITLVFIGLYYMNTKVMS